MMLSPKGCLGFAETPGRNTRQSYINSLMSVLFKPGKEVSIPICKKISYLKEGANNLNYGMPPKGCKWRLHWDALPRPSGLLCTGHLRQ